MTRRSRSPRSSCEMLERRLLLASVFVSPGESINDVLDVLRGTSGPHTITLGDGRHEISETILIDSDDITVAAENTGQATISGGVPVTSWQHLANGRYRGVVGWSAPRFRMLTIDDSPAPIARGETAKVIAWDTAARKIVVPAAVPVGHEMVVQRHWDVDIFTVTAVEVGPPPLYGYLITPAEPDRTILFDFSIHRQKRAGQTYYGQGAGYLDEHNEWAVDGPYLYVQRTDGTPPQNVVRPTVQTLLRVENAAGVTIDGVVFEDSAWDTPGFSGVQTSAYYDTGPSHAGWKTIPSAVEIAESDDVAVVDSVFKNLGTSGLLVTHSSNVTIADSEFRDIAATGLSIGDLAPIQPAQTGIVVTGNTIERVGTYFSGAAGLLASYIDGAVISENTVRNVPYDGFAIGGGWWDWNNVQVPNNVISGNTIEWAAQLHDDAAGIYVRGHGPGSVIEDNTIRDMAHSPTSGGHPVVGVYFDNGAHEWTATGNTITDVPDAFFEHPVTLPTVNTIAGNTVQENVPPPASTVWDFDPATAVWTHLVTHESFTFGIPGDTPITGDWDGDGDEDVGIWRDAMFFLDANGDHVAGSGDWSTVFGLESDTPTAGDWDSDGLAEIGVGRNGVWFLDRGNGVWDGMDIIVG